MHGLCDVRLVSARQLPGPASTTASGSTGRIAVSTRSRIQVSAHQHTTTYLLFAPSLSLPNFIVTHPENSSPECS